MFELHRPFTAGEREPLRCCACGMRLAMDCAVRHGSCDDAFAIYKDILRLSMRNTSDIEAVARARFPEQYAQCK
jgi:hypothetical protein